LASDVVAVHQFPPHAAVAQAAEQRQRQHEQHAHPGWQPTDPLLHPAGGDKDLVDESGRDMLSKNAQADALPHRTRRRGTGARTRTACGKI
jgi:hypothetical protein